MNEHLQISACITQLRKNIHRPNTTKQIRWVLSSLPLEKITYILKAKQHIFENIWRTLINVNVKDLDLIDHSNSNIFVKHHLIQKQFKVLYKTTKRQKCAYRDNHAYIHVNKHIHTHIQAYIHCANTMCSLRRKLS